MFTENQLNKLNILDSHF